MKKGKKALKYADLLWGDEKAKKDNLRRSVQELEPKQATPRGRTLLWDENAFHSCLTLQLRM